MNCLIPRQKAPELTVPTLNSGLWSLETSVIQNFVMVVFYRHKNCGVCRSYLSDLAARTHDFKALGVETVAISTDDFKGAQAMFETLPKSDLRIGYNLSFESADAWGLYLSSARKDIEPDIFSEPGLFLVNRDRRLYYASVQSMPFGRTEFKSLLEWLPKVIDQSIPARGEYQRGTA